jgi:hypothetical protein
LKALTCARSSPGKTFQASFSCEGMHTTSGLGSFGTENSQAAQSSRATVAAWSAHVTVIMTRILIQGFPSLSPRIPFRQTLADFSVREPPHVSRSVCNYFLRNSSRPNLAGVLSPLRVPAFTTKLAPSDPRDSVFSDRHARPVTCTRDTRTRFPSLHPTAFQRSSLIAPAHVSKLSR